MKKAAIAALVALLAGTGLVLFIGGGLSTRAHAITCAPGEPLSVADVPEGEVAGYSGDQLRHAATIMRVGAQKGADAWGQTIGVMAAMGESSLRNVDHGDDVGPDSRGLFQQRDNWGPLEARMDPATAAGMFFDALLQVEGWRELEPTIAAHRVQRNADPLHYAEHWNAAVDVVTALAGVTAQPSGSNRYDLGPVKPHIQALAEEIGTVFGVDEVGGYRASAVDSGGHPAGLAVDFMTHDDTATGDAIAAYAIEHAERLSVDYIIWQQHYWSAANPETGWQPMADRGSRTANHLDHPHINVTPTPNPSAGGDPVGCLAATIGGAPIAATGDWVAPLDAPITSRFCGSPQIVEGFGLRGVRDGRCGGLLVVDG